MTKTEKLSAELSRSRAKLTAAREELATLVARVERLAILEDADLASAQKTLERFSILEKKLSAEVDTLERDLADAEYQDRLVAARSAAEAEESDIKKFSEAWEKARRAINEGIDVTRTLDPALINRLRLGGVAGDVATLTSMGVLSPLGKIVGEFDKIPAACQYARNVGPVAELARVKAERE